MDTRLAHLLWWLIVYIDDLLISAPTLPELRARTREVRSALREMGVEVNEDKSEYETRTLLFAGITITSETIGPNVAQARKVLSLPVPRTKKDMQSALGLVSYLRDFIPLASHFSGALYPSESKPVLPEEDLQKHWHSLLRHIASAITSLRHWREEEDADLFADASGYGIGVILIQEGKVVALASRKLTPAETRYSATDREHLALVYVAKKFKIFLHRPKGVTRVHSDHAALVGKRSDDMTPRQERWQYITTQWLPNLSHVAGASNPADYVSRWRLEIKGGVEKL
jgi:hypothetical protein